ncbi:Thioredoxin-like protein Clot [Phytophthora citrophthora]|uniref:Thioredoxin-like protein Clot n=1 Tax=Phytophthora citrophthora TaxID=4793 RepID=A0AAD9GB60_9STRA|nr:Thioredoxin-like protein Clot [Phytophthora citrophthora]
MSSSSHRGRSHRSDVRVWVRRNVWLVAAVTLVIVYCVFMVRTTMWAHAFEAQQERERAQESDKLTRDGDAMKEALAVLKEMGAIRGESTHEQAEEQAEEAVEDGRDQLVKGEGEQEAVGEEEAHNAHAAATTGPRLRTVEEEDTVAYDDKVPLEDVGDIPNVGATVATEVETTTNAPAEDKWTALDLLPTAAEAENEKEEVAIPPIETQSTENKGPPPLTPRTGDHLWTGMDQLPVAGNENTGLEARVPEVPTTIAQVQPSEFKSRRFDKSRLNLESSNASIPFEKRHHVIFGYNATLAYLQLNMKPADSKEELFLFFTCSDSKGGRDDWNPNCATAREKVYATFAKSPSTNRLVTIHAGPRDDWRGGNAFTDDDDLRLKAVPTLMRWDGGAPGALRSTWGVLVDNSILYEPLVRYLFRNGDKQDKLLAKAEVETKEIITLRGYAQYRTFMETYARNGSVYPLFMMMVSGRFERNNRLWCPWCRQSEMPVEYAFYAYSPPNAKLVLVETYDKYSEWRNPENEFKQDPQLAMKGVPWFYRVYPGPPGAPLTYQRVKKKFYILEALQQVFQDSSEL